MHLQVICSDSMSLSEVVEAFAKDLDRQVRMKLNVMEEEAQN